MPRRIDTQAEIDAIRLKEATAPGTPASGYGKLYAKTDGKLYWKDDAGTETDITGAGSSNGIWNADVPPSSPSAYDDEFNDSSFSTDWVVVNAKTEVTEETTKGLHLYIASNPGSGMTMYKKSSPSTPWDIYARIELMFPFGNYGGVWLAVRNSSSGRIITYGYGDGSVRAFRWNNATSYNATIGTYPTQGYDLFFRIENDGTNLNFYHSLSGRYWYKYGTEALASFISSVDEIGFALSYDGTPNGVFSWFRVNDQGGGTI